MMTSERPQEQQAPSPEAATGFWKRDEKFPAEVEQAFQSEMAWARTRSRLAHDIDAVRRLGRMRAGEPV